MGLAGTIPFGDRDCIHGKPGITDVTLLQNDGSGTALTHSVPCNTVHQSLALRLDMPEPHDLLAYRKETKGSIESEEKTLFSGEVLVKRVGGRVAGSQPKHLSDWDWPMAGEFIFLTRSLLSTGAPVCPPPRLLGECDASDLI